MFRKPGYYSISSRINENEKINTLSGHSFKEDFQGQWKQIMLMAGFLRVPTPFEILTKHHLCKLYSGANNYINTNLKTNNCYKETDNNDI